MTIMELIVWITIIWIIVVSSVKFMWEWITNIVKSVNTYRLLWRFHSVIEWFDLIKQKYWLRNLDSILIKNWIVFFNTREWRWWWVLYAWYFWKWELVIYRWEKLTWVRYDRRDLLLFFENSWKIRQIWKIWKLREIDSFEFHWLRYLNKVKNLYATVEMNWEKFNIKF